MQRQRDTCVLPHLNTCCATSYSIKWLDSLEMRFKLSSASFTFTFLFLEMPLDTISTQSTGMIAAKCTFKLSRSHSLSLASQHLQTAGLKRGQVELELTSRKFSVCSGLIGAFHYVRGILFDNNFVLVLVAGFSSEWKLKYLFRKNHLLESFLSFSLHSSFPLSLSRSFCSVYSNPLE